MSKVTCIDVSCWQTGIDYKKIKNSGIEAVIIRAGYGREVSQKDSEFETHYKDAKSADLKIGAYWYSYADSVDDAKREAQACLTCIKDKKFDLPIYFDMEDPSQVKLSKSTLTDMAITFCDTIKASGYTPGVYANLNWFSNHLDYSKLKSKYSIWLAQYNDTNQLDCDIWQNASNGRLDGYGGRLDTNIIFNRNILSSTSKDNSPSKDTNKNNNKNNKVSVPVAIYKVRITDGSRSRWLPEVKNLEDYAGIPGKSINAVAVKFTTGKCKYRVMVGDRWLPYVTGYDQDDYNNGYAGNGAPISAIEVYYETPADVAKQRGYYRAKYRVSPNKGEYYDWQYDDEKSNGQDGYAGTKGIEIDRFQLTVSK